MASIDSNERYGVHEMVRGLHGSLQQYIEAQYHIRDDGIIQERNALLQQPAVIAQRAYVEATPVYLTEKGYVGLSIPKLAQTVLRDIAALGDNVGLYPTPYRHQVDALEAFLGPEQDDLVVATGTGSGKTESFLMPLVATLAMESEERPKSRDLSGCRAILFYPMNALVNDQVARIRSLLGNKTVNALVASGRSRPVRFGSYTGRTSYPGKRTSQKDAQNIAPLFDEFYSKVQKNTLLRTKLEKMGRWPSKDLEAFYNEGVATTTTVKTGGRAGKSHNLANWKYRLLTQPGDRELMTRHEMQASCPDVLVTNYSMLEYMLMRPIESPLFEQTTIWLNSDERNELILVLDEAHMYRGAGGAEVALLIRRLIARLGISRDRVRCILTSASLGTDEQTRLDIVEFAKGLTGVTTNSKRKFRVVTATKESRSGAAPATNNELNALRMTNFEVIADHALNPGGAVAAISKLAASLGWPTMIGDNLKDYLYATLTGFGPAELLIENVSGNATALDELNSIIFPSTASSNDKERALARLFHKPL
ncbi:MAG: DEAD/DEAH box helicase [Nitrosospira sp.]